MKVLRVSVVVIKNRHEEYVAQSRQTLLHVTAAVEDRLLVITESSPVVEIGVYPDPPPTTTYLVGQAARSWVSIGTESYNVLQTLDEIEAQLKG